jgi:hypothetical protein
VNGPRRPDQPTTRCQTVAETYWGLLLTAQGYEDGYVYELGVPMDRARPFTAREGVVNLLENGSLLSAFEADSVNYLTVWVPKAVHDRLYPDGPPEYRYYGEQDQLLPVA